MEWVAGDESERTFLSSLQHSDVIGIDNFHPIDAVFVRPLGRHDLDAVPAAYAAQRAEERIAMASEHHIAHLSRFGRLRNSAHPQVEDALIATLKDDGGQI
jgi:hypothetical protein